MLEPLPHATGALPPLRQDPSVSGGLEPVRSGREPGVTGEEEAGRVGLGRGADALSLSPEGLAALAGEEAEEGTKDDEEVEPGTERSTTGEPLTKEEQEQVRELRARDAEVRAHENAHKAAAGELARGGPTYETQRGPDGRDYAVGGSVQIALEEGRTPDETIAKAERARRAALAPAEPSSQDYKVAAEAAAMAAEARAEKSREDSSREEAPSGGSSGSEAEGEDQALGRLGGFLDVAA